MPDADGLASFSLDMLAGHATNAAPLWVDADGLLVVANRTRWRPVKFGEGLRTIWCARADDDPPGEVP